MIIHWDNLSELIPDPLTLKHDFEGYEVWRADDWHRPLGTTESSGPEQRAVASARAGRPRERRVSRSRFQRIRRPSAASVRAARAARGQELRSSGRSKNPSGTTPSRTIPCPPGLTSEECDTLEALARWNLGYEGGRQYYQYMDNDAKNGMPYFYAVVAYDHAYDSYGEPSAIGECDYPYSNFQYVVPRSSSQEAEEFRRATCTSCRIP